MEHQKELTVILKQGNNGRKNFYCQEIANKQSFRFIRKIKTSQSHGSRGAGNTLRIERAIPTVKLEARAGQAIKSFLAEKGLQRPLRIHLQFTGCCDPSLGLSVDNIRESDLIQEVDGLMFVISSEVHQLVGDVTISYTDKFGRKGFILTSDKPVSEWDGLGVCAIGILPDSQ